MFLLNKSHHLGFLILIILRLSRCDNSEEKNEEGQESFLKKQGPEIPDQIAIETGVHEQVEQLPGFARYPPVPVPVPMQGYPGSLVLPLPPGQEGGGNGPKQVHPPEGLHGGQLHGQFSTNHHIRHPGPLNFQPPPHHPHQHDGRIMVPKGKDGELLVAAPGQGGPPHMSHNSAEAHFKHHQQQQQQQQQHQQQQQQQQRPLFNPPHSLPPFRGDQGPPKPHHLGGVQAGQEALTASILKEFLAKAQGGGGKPHHRFPGPPPPPHGGIWGPPGKQNVLHGGPPQGKPFQASKEVANDLQAEGGEFPGPVVQYGGVLGPNPAGPWAAGPEAPDMAKIVTLDVKCEKNVMRIFIAFDRPFYGVIFSKGHYHNVHCIHLPAGLGHTSANFDIGIDSCGTQSNAGEATAVGSYGAPPSGAGSFFENIIVIQYDAQVQEVWDQARKLRCTWHDQYEKTVTFRPFPVDMLDVVRADFAGDNVGCWMQIQVGKGPWASEVSGLVKIGQEMTMVLAIKDDDNKFDMLVRNCFASDGQRSPIQLVDRYGCISRPKLMSRFTKIKNFGASASVLSYAHFQAFKFPDSMEVHFQCTIQICRYECPEQCAQGGEAGPGGYVGKSGLASDKEEGDEAGSARRRRRSPQQLNETSSVEDEDAIYEYTTTFKITRDEQEDVGLNRIITVVSNDDLDLLSQNAGLGGTVNNVEESVPVVEASVDDIVCMSTFGFASMLVILIGCLLIACVVSAILILRKPRKY